MENVFLDQLMNSSFTSFFVPFLLVFAIVFGILSKINIFKKEGANEVEEKRVKRINLGISLVIGLIFASVSLASNCLGALFPKFAIVLAVIFVFYVLVGLFIDLENKKSAFNIIISILVIGAFLFILFLSSEACGIKIGPINLIIGSWWKWAVGVLVILGMISWVIKGSGSETKEKVKQVSKETPQKTPQESPPEEAKLESKEETL